MGECGKTGGSLSCPLVAPLSRLVGMNGYNSVILCKPALHSGKGLQGRLSYHEHGAACGQTRSVDALPKG